ncbi:MAG: hypothetical protein QM346_00345 [Chloroflexota bacterium]|jgi:hypothetical protein|nr:hypothetical protein [Chloroflexota bacterium]
MAEKLRIFVSATHDLENERSVIGKALAELPVQIGAEIRRTPVEGASYDDIFELIANVDRVYFLLGADITAPAGAEWQLAEKLERSLYPLRKATRVTLAAQDFMRLGFFRGWTVFSTSAELERLVTLDLVRILNHPKNRYGLTLNELELLNLHAKRIRAAQPVPPAGEPSGAEGGGVLLDAGHEEREEGELLEE